MRIHHFPEEGAGALVLRRATGEWVRWLPAAGPISVNARHIGLLAATAQLDDPRQLPRRLAGLSLRNTGATDDHIAAAARHFRSLTWLDTRGTAVTEVGLRAFSRHAFLRRVAVDDGVSAERVAPRARLVTGETAVVPIVGDLPVPASWEALVELAASVTGSTGAGHTTVDAAVGRASMLSDAKRPAEALGVLAPVLGTREPAVLYLAARIADNLGRPLEALAALEPAPMTPHTAACRALVLCNRSAYASLMHASDALRVDPSNYLAHWCRVASYLHARQPAAAAWALQDVVRLQPASLDTLRLVARVHAAAGKRREALAAWGRLLAERPDDANALASVATLQQRAWSTRWSGSLLRAANADMDAYGGGLGAKVREHRRAVARVAGSVVGGFLAVTGDRWLVGKSAAIPVVAYVATSLLVAGLFWWRTPVAVRRVIRRTDDLTGTRMRADWRRLVVAAAVAAVALATFGDFRHSPGCKSYRSGCRPTVVVPKVTVPTIPHFSFTPFSFAPFSFAPFPTAPLTLAPPLRPATTRTPPAHTRPAPPTPSRTPAAVGAGQ